MGGVMLANARNQQTTDLGQNVILFGLFLQIVIVAFFIVVGAVFHRRVKQKGLAMKTTRNFAWGIYLNMLSIVRIIITLRNLFRVTEFAMGGKL
jgi:hypothetical protein